MEAFMLFGDSLTQQSFSQERGFALGAALTDAYVRRLDVINRGYSGYNSEQALKTIDKVIPSPATQKLRFLTIWFGANDSRLPDTPGTSQHVPLERYVANMRKIITHPLIRAHEDVRIIVLTPPPVEETLQWDLDREKFADLKSPRRVVESNAAYAKAVRELANELDVVCLDVWSLLIEKTGHDAAGGKPLPGSRSSGIDPVLAELLRDGLHFNPAGYKVVYDELMSLIARTWPDQMPDKLSFILPAWDHPSAWSQS